jgi:hypothetical protein
LVVVLTAPLLVPYQTIFGLGLDADVLDELMKLPPWPRFLRYGTITLQLRNNGFTLILISQSNSSLSAS